VSKKITFLSSGGGGNLKFLDLLIKKNLAPDIFLSVIADRECGALTYARNAGIKSAKGKYILFCDDDNWLDENYIHRGFKLLKTNPKIGVLGGRSQAMFETKEPFWFSTFQSNYAVGVQAIDSGDITNRGYVWGAGSFMRRQTLLKMYESGFKHFCVGRMGNVLLAGDDSEISKWHILIGEKLWYDDQLSFKHFIPDNRLNKEYLLNIMNGFDLSKNHLDKLDLFIYLSNIYSTKRKIRMLFTILLKFLCLKSTFNEFNEGFSIIINRSYFLTQNCLVKVVIDAKNKYLSFG
jgi:glycosyltransferase involved in cell wall biosynthesis